nr:ribonuclease H-like domain, reverse transcriptase, RNA-dependent DNA polymerase [Tanacetum cinerariifolium]
ILKDFIRQAENQFNHKVKTIRSDNGIEFKNTKLIELCGLKGIKREYSNARTLQQNEVAKRKNRTLIEAARTMLADSFLPTTFWAEEPVLVENQANKSAGPKEANTSADKIKNTTDFKTCEKLVSQVEQIFLEDLEKLKRQEKEANEATRKETTHENQNAHTNNTNLFNTTPLSAAGPLRAFNNGELSYPDDSIMPHLEDIYASPSEGIFTDSSYDDECVVTDFNNLETTMNVSLTPITRIHTIHLKAQILGDPMIEAIRIFLAFASYMGFIIYQMDVKSTFLYGIINEEVYVSQPPGFVDLKFPNKVYKVVKALYGLHQAPRAWYATLSTFLEKSGYRRRDTDKTLFIKQYKKDIMLVQVYVDDIILALQKSLVNQKEDGNFISQDKYVAKILKKFDFLSVKTASTPIKTQKPLVKDEEAANVDSVLVLDFWLLQRLHTFKL